MIKDPDKTISQIKESLDLAISKAQDLTTLLYQACANFPVKFNASEISKLSKFNLNAWKDLEHALPHFKVISSYSHTEIYKSSLTKIKFKINGVLRWAVKGARLVAEKNK